MWAKMMIIDTAMLWRQFGAAIDMLGDALRDCPDELWEKSLWEDQPDQWVAAGFSAFWYLGYHTLFWLDLYLTGAEEGFAPPAPFDLVEMEAGEALPRTYTRAELLGYLDYCRRTCQETISALSTNRLRGCAGLPGESCPLRSFSSITCGMCRSTARSCACSWGSRREHPQAGFPKLNDYARNCS